MNTYTSKARRKTNFKSDYLCEERKSMELSFHFYFNWGERTLKWFKDRTKKLGSVLYIDTVNQAKGSWSEAVSGEVAKKGGQLFWSMEYNSLMTPKQKQTLVKRFSASPSNLYTPKSTSSFFLHLTAWYGHSGKLRPILCAFQRKQHHIISHMISVANLICLHRMKTAIINIYMNRYVCVS
jgi:hypothetical protein